MQDRQADCERPRHESGNEEKERRSWRTAIVPDAWLFVRSWNCLAPARRGMSRCGGWSMNPGSSGADRCRYHLGLRQIKANRISSVFAVVLLKA
jgi:hypothetical protein